MGSLFWSYSKLGQVTTVDVALVVEKQAISIVIPFFHFIIQNNISILTQVCPTASASRCLSSVSPLAAFLLLHTHRAHFPRQVHSPEHR